MALLFISNGLRFERQDIRINSLLHCVFLLSHLAVALGEINSRLFLGLLSRFAFASLTIILVRCGSAFLESLDFAVNLRKHVSVRLILHDVSPQTGFYSLLHLAVSTGTPLGWYKVVRAGHRFGASRWHPVPPWARSGGDSAPPRSRVHRRRGAAPRQTGMSEHPAGSQHSTGKRQEFESPRAYHISQSFSFRELVLASLKRLH